MKLSWRDVITTLFALAGGAVVYAKIYDYSWAVIGSWRSAAMVLAGIGILMFAFSGVTMSNRSVLNVGEMALGVVALGLAVVGAIMTSEFVFYALAVAMGVLWLTSTTRHIYHSIAGDTTEFHHPAHVQ